MLKIEFNDPSSLASFLKLQSFPSTVDLELDDDERLQSIAVELDTLLDKYLLKQQKQELLYLIITKEEDIWVRYEAFHAEYVDNKKAKEIASLLLLAESVDMQKPTLTVKPLRGSSINITDESLVSWIIKNLYKNFESRDAPIGFVGEQIYYQLFGNDIFSKTPIDPARLEALSKMKLTRPKLKYNKLLVEFCLYIKSYLDNFTNMKASQDVLITDRQANFLFDILEVLGYCNREEIQSEPKDYIGSLLRNNLKARK